MPVWVQSTTAVYQFDELSDAAKEKARDWFREGVFTESQDWQFVYEDAVQCAAILGIEIGTKSQNWVNPTTRKSGTTHSPAIFFSGFSSQGDGACFEGSYSYAKSAHKKIRSHAPKDEKLHAMADELFSLQKANRYRLTATTKHSGHYFHSGCMDVEVYLGDGCNTGEYPSGEIGKAVVVIMRRFADWIYRQLESENDYRHSAEVVDDNIRANEYEFTEDGSRA